MCYSEFNTHFSFVDTREITHEAGMFFRFERTEELPVHKSVKTGVEFFVIQGDDPVYGGAYFELGAGIFISQRLIELLSVDELDAVLAHENHHAHAGHVETMQALLRTQEALPAETFLWLQSRLSHKNELEADRAAGALGLGKDLITGLNKITAGFTGECHTHPSTAARAKALNV